MEKFKVNNYRNTEQKMTIIGIFNEMLSNSKLTIISICLAFSLYFLLSDSIFLLILGLLGSIYIVIVFPMQLPVFFTDTVGIYPFLSKDLESNYSTQKRKAFPLLLAALFELLKALLMFILGFGTFFASNP